MEYRGDVMNNTLTTTGRWLVGCLVATILGFFLGLSQDHSAQATQASASRIQWPAAVWGSR
jgi:ABC-type nitrate/sulfonate/bicarbonate transport system permease component